MLEEVCREFVRESESAVAKRKRLNGALEPAASSSGESASTAEPDQINIAQDPSFIAQEQTEVVSGVGAGFESASGGSQHAAFGESSHYRLADVDTVGNASLPPEQGVTLTPLELRIRRLEDALAQLQELRAGQVASSGADPAAPTGPDEPAAQVTTDKIWSFGQRAFRTPIQTAKNFAASAKRPGLLWLLSDAWTDVRAIYRLFTDPRYSPSWTGRIGAPVLLIMILTSWWWVPFTSLSVIGHLIDKSVDLVLAFILFKLLGYEARRYRETAPDLPTSLRL
jgi:hypothetical protein